MTLIFFFRIYSVFGIGSSIIWDNTALGMSGELENAEHSKHSEGHEGATDFAVVSHQEADVVWHDGHKVYHWHHRPCELPPEARKLISLTHLAFVWQLRPARWQRGKVGLIGRPRSSHNQWTDHFMCIYKRFSEKIFSPELGLATSLKFQTSGSVNLISLLNRWLFFSWKYRIGTCATEPLSQALAM